MAKKIQVDELADVISETMEEYAAMASEEVKEAVRSTGKTVRKQIRDTAPKKSESYSKSWSVKTMKETSQTLHVVVHSRTRYMLAHLLENGHAKRGGGRTRAFPHIADAEKIGEEKLLKDIERALS